MNRQSILSLRCFGNFARYQASTADSALEEAVKGSKEAMETIMATYQEAGASCKGLGERAMPLWTSVAWVV